MSKTIFDLVKEDLDVRNAIGYENWQKELYPEDGRDWLLEAYAEILDLAIYLKGELLKREGPPARSTLQPNTQRQSQVSPLPPNGKTPRGCEPL